MKTEPDYKLKINDITCHYIRPDFDIMEIAYKDGLIVIYTLEFTVAPHELRAFTTFTRGCELNLADNFYKKNKRIGEICVPHGNRWKNCVIYVNDV